MASFTLRRATCVPLLAALLALSLLAVHALFFAAGGAPPASTRDCQVDCHEQGGWCIDWYGRRCPQRLRDTDTLCCDRAPIEASCGACRATADGYRCCARWSDCVACCIHNSSAARMPAEPRFEVCRDACRRNGRTINMRAPHCIDDRDRRNDTPLPPEQSRRQHSAADATPAATQQVYVLVTGATAAAPPDDRLAVRRHGGGEPRYVEF